MVVCNRRNNYQKVISVQESHKFPDWDVKEFEQLSESNALIFISRLYNAPSIPRNHVQIIFDMTHSLMYAGLSKLHKQITQVCKVLLLKSYKSFPE